MKTILVVMLCFLSASVHAATIFQINAGAAANDGTGDTLRTSQLKANTNFVNLNNALSNVTAGVAQATNVTTTNATKFGIYKQTTDGVLQFFGIEQGSNIVMYRTVSNIVINATGTGSDSTNVATFASGFITSGGLVLTNALTNSGFFRQLGSVLFGGSVTNDDMVEFKDGIKQAPNQTAALGDITAVTGLFTNTVTINGTNIVSYVDTASSNRVRLTAGTGGITFSQSGSGGVQTWTVNDDDFAGSVQAGIWTNVVYVNATNASSIINGMTLTNAVKNAPQWSLVVIGPGFYATPENSYPSVMLSKDNISTYWMPGSHWTNGFRGMLDDGKPMWEDSAGARTNCNILGYGRFFSIEPSGANVYLENNTKMFIQGRFDFTNSVGDAAGGSFYVGNSAAQDITFDVDFAACWSYDAIWGSADGGLKLKGEIRELVSQGDLVELGGDSPSDGLVDLKIGLGRVPIPSGQSTFIAMGGRTRIRFDTIIVTATNATISVPHGVTQRSYLEGGTIYFPANGKVSPIRGDYTHSPFNLWMKNVTIHCPTNLNFAQLSNTYSAPLTLENCTIYNGHGATHFATSFTNDSYLRIVGSLNQYPELPRQSLGTSNVVIIGTNWFPGLRVAGATTNEGILSASQMLVGSGGITVSAETASRPVFLDANRKLVAASGTPDGTKFLRDDGVLAVPAGGTAGTNLHQLLVTNNTIIGGSLIVTNSIDALGNINGDVLSGNGLVGLEVGVTGTTASRPAYINGDNLIVAAIGTPTGYRVMKDDGSLTDISNKVVVSSGPGISVAPSALGDAMNFTITALGGGGVGNFNINQFSASSTHTNIKSGVELTNAVSRTSFRVSGNQTNTGWLVMESGGSAGLTLDGTIFYPNITTVAPLLGLGFAGKQLVMSSTANRIAWGAEPYGDLGLRAGGGFDYLSGSNGLFQSSITNFGSMHVSGSKTLSGPRYIEIDRMTNGQTTIPITAGNGPDFSITTSSNMVFTFSGSPVHGQRLSLSLTNAGLTNIIVTIPSAYSLQLGSNVTSWLVLSNKYTRLDYSYSTNEMATGGMWRIDTSAEYEATLVVAGGLVLHTNAMSIIVSNASPLSGSSFTADLEFTPDNTYNIGGVSGASRPKDIYAGGHIFATRILPTNAIGGIQIGHLAGSGGDNTNGINVGLQAGQGATNSYSSLFFGQGAGYLANNAYSSHFEGVSAGQQSHNAYSSHFDGYASGYRSSNAYNSHFEGDYTGYFATNVYGSHFHGYSAGRDANNAYFSHFHGHASGAYANNTYGSHFDGYIAGYQATNAYYSHFDGYAAGYLANGAHNSIFLGREVGTNGTYQPYTLMIGNSQYSSLTNHLIYGEFNNRLLRVNGTLEVTEGITTRIFTNYVSSVSNFVFTSSTNTYELMNQANIVFTNIVELPMGRAGPIEVVVHNTSGGIMGLVWPAYGAQHGYYFRTNVANPIITSTTLAPGKSGVASLKLYGTNVFATWTEWP